MCLVFRYHSLALSARALALVLFSCMNSPKSLQKDTASADLLYFHLFFHFCRNFGDSAFGLRKFLRLPPDWREAEESTLEGIEAEVSTSFFFDLQEISLALMFPPCPLLVSFGL